MLSAFFEEMRRELRLTEADFTQWMGVMVTADVISPEYQDAYDGYSAQLMRIGQTSDMLGLPGFGMWCTYVVNALTQLSVIDETARGQTAHYFARWPKLVDAYFSEPAGLEVSMALSEYLTDAASPLPLDETNAVDIF